MEKDIRITNNVALDAFESLKDTSGFGKMEVLEKVTLFQIYLEQLGKNISNKTPKNGFILQWVFTNEFDDKDVNKYIKANIIAASASLKRIISHIIDNEITPYINRLLSDFICDLKPFITYFDKEQSYDWLLVNPNIHVSNFYFDLAQNVFFSGKPGTKKEENLALASSTPFIIRQSLEYKIKRILGINYIESNGKPDKTLASVYFKALRNNLRFYKIKKFDFETIEKIYTWTHSYIHGGIRAKPWKTETALNYLEEFFYSGKTSQPNSWSLYAGIETEEENLDALKNNTCESLKKQLGQDIKIVWLSKPELAIMKKVRV